VVRNPLRFFPVFLKFLTVSLLSPPEKYLIILENDGSSIFREKTAHEVSGFQRGREKFESGINCHLGIGGYKEMIYDNSYLNNTIKSLECQYLLDF
jgi:hypothetical protein